MNKPDSLMLAAARQAQFGPETPIAPNAMPAPIADPRDARILVLEAENTKLRAINDALRRAPSVQPEELRQWSSPAKRWFSIAAESDSHRIDTAIFAISEQDARDQFARPDYRITACEVLVTNRPDKP